MCLHNVYSKHNAFSDLTWFLEMSHTVATLHFRDNVDRSKHNDYDYSDYVVFRQCYNLHSFISLFNSQVTMCGLF